MAKARRTRSRAPWIGRRPTASSSSSVPRTRSPRERSNASCLRPPPRASGVPLDLEHVANRLAVPDVAQVLALATVRENARTKRADAPAALVSHRVVDDAARAAGAKGSPEQL